MSIAVASWSKHFIVLAADSRTTIWIRDAAGNHPIAFFDSETKIIPFPAADMAFTICGPATIGSYFVSSLIRRFTVESPIYDSSPEVHLNTLVNEFIPATVGNALLPEELTIIAAGFHSSKPHVAVFSHGRTRVLVKRRSGFISTVPRLLTVLLFGKTVEQHVLAVTRHIARAKARKTENLTIGGPVDLLVLEPGALRWIRKKKESPDFTSLSDFVGAIRNGTVMLATRSSQDCLWPSLSRESEWRSLLGIIMSYHLAVLGIWNLVFWIQPLTI